ncbi:MAG: SDR family oxidoreductase [Alphaproteobacteria bacterium]|nr:SDR family oxidoreductase [Alphaproteobacteria bacterium]
MDLKLKGKNAVILGGTRGIGRAIAETLAGEGVNIALCARTQEQIDEATKALSGKGVKAIGGRVDIADADGLKKWIGEAGKALGGIDLLVSNASALDVGNTAAAWSNGLAIDILGAVNSFEAAEPFLKDAAKSKGEAACVFITSVSGAEADSAQAYGAIKAALIHFAKGLARQHAPGNIRVNTVSPGTVYFKGGVWNMIEEHMPAMFKDAMERNPTGRMATPQEIANATVFLLSPLSSFTTGANLIVDGAITRRVNF